MLTFRLKSQTLAVLVTKQKTHPNTHLFHHGCSTTQSLISQFDCGSGLLVLTTCLPYFGPPSSSLNLFIFPFSPLPPPLLLSLHIPLFHLPPGPAGLWGANHQTAAPLSPLTEQLPPPQQCTTLLDQSPAWATTIWDPHLANRGGGLGRGGPSGLMEGTRRVNYWGATAAH